MEKFTKGPWRAGNGFVISEHSNGITISGATGEDAIKYYGGNMIGESISQYNSHLIAAAPDMYKMLDTIETVLSGNSEYNATDISVDYLRKLLAKARGEL